MTEEIAAIIKTKKDSVLITFPDKGFRLEIMENHLDFWIDALIVAQKKIQTGVVDEY